MLQPTTFLLVIIAVDYILINSLVIYVSVEACTHPNCIGLIISLFFYTEISPHLFLHSITINVYHLA